MSDLLKRLADLSPEKRRLVEMRLQLARAEAAGPVLGPRARGDAVPLSYAQQRLWLVEQMQPGTPAYNVLLTLRLRGALDAPALERALDALRARHESLRTTFEVRGDEAVQVVHPPAPAPLEVVDLSPLAADAAEAEAARQVGRDANRGFDLRTGPVVRARLLRLGAQEHVLQVVMHHIVSDGWSMAILTRELGELYTAFAAGRPEPLPPPALQYADYALWQREWMRGEPLERMLSYWRGKLEGAPVLELPTDRPRPPVESHRGAAVPLEMAAGPADRMRALAAEEGTTLFTVLLAAVKALLARHAAQDDVVVGTAVANRTRSATEGLVGFFVNTLALRTDLSGDPTFRELVRRVKETTIGAFQHQEMPFELLVQELNVERDASRNPLFQVIFGLQNAPGPAMDLPGLSLQVEPVTFHSAKFDLGFDLSEAPDGRLGGRLEFALDLFDADTAERLAERLCLLAGAAAEDPDARLSALPAMPAGEGGLLAGWAAAPADYPRGRTVVSLFDEAASAAPDALAAAFGGSRLTYAELRAGANRLARRLRALGVGPESRVGVSMERSADLVVTLLAVLKAGGAYVPLDPSYPAERRAFMLADAGVSVLVVAGEVPEAAAGFAGTVVSLAGDAQAIAAEPGEDPEDAGLDPDSAAYVVYTSGSTGRPKGIAVPHRGVVRLVRGTDYVRLAAEDRVAQLSNASFDAATFEVWGALLNGAALIGVSRDETLSPASLAEAFRREGITAAFLTTALFHGVAREAPDAFRTLTHLLFGGEACDPAAVRRVLRAGGPRRLLHVYGPTESTTFATWHLVDAVAEEAATVPIGRPVANTTAWVLDGGMRPVPIGVAGELYLGGDGLARGYPGRAGLTAERFVPDPLSAEAGARLYRTGDRVRWNAAGGIEFAGRLDDQVKIRGFRIEPGEVEALLASHPAVRDAAVAVREDGGERRLVGYVVAAEGEDVTGPAVRAWLQRTLPEYMVPSAVVVLDAIPLTPNGKVDRRALPAPERGGAGEEGWVAPRAGTEEVLAGIWSEVLGVPRVGARDDFFALGGHSLLATRVVSRVRQLLGTELPLRALFEAPTVRGLAARVDASASEGGEPLPPVEPVGRDGGLPLSFAQERMWFLHRMEPGSSTYNVPLAVELRGPLDAAALARALTEVARRHEALRAVFVDDGAGPVQRFLPALDVPLPVADLSGRGEEAVDAAVAEAALRPFDLATGPLFRAALVRAEAERHVLVLSTHHAVSDGWSTGVLLREVSALYAAAVGGGEAELPPLPVQYADFAAWQRRHLSGERLERQLRWWRERLDGAPATLELPTDRPRPPVQTFRGDVRGFALPAELSARVRELTRAEGATLFMTVLAAFQVLLSRWARQADVVVGTPIAGRNREETEGLIGMFVNTLVLRSDLSDDPTFRELLARVRETTLGAYAHQDLPFERLVEELNVERSQSHAPLFQVMLALQNAPAGGLEMPGLQVSQRGFGWRTAKFDLTLNVEEAGDVLAGAIEFATDLFDGATIERMAAHLATLLEGIVADPDRPVSQLAILPPEERALVVRGFNDLTARPHYRRDVLMHEWLQAQVARTPDAPAVVAGEATLTYAELNARANRLARWLRGRGVGPEVRVGVLMERTEELIVALYAVLKAGGAYVPLDPAYPAERVAFMLADTRVPVLLTHAHLVARLPETTAEVFRVDADWTLVRGESDEDLPRIASPDNLAYLIYTSGSTGTPKGVQLEHRGAAVVVQWMRDEFPDDLRTSVLASTSVCFDVSIAEIFGTLSWGGKIVLVRDALSLASLPAGQEVVMASMVPSAAAELLRMEGLPRTVRSLNLGGEPVKPSLSDALHATGHVEQVVNLYGPSEDTTYTTALRIPPGVRRMTVGRPVANTQVHVLDPRLEPTPVGVPGELYIGGHGVTRGYHDRPGMTAERYLPDPFSPDAGARMYRTGDLARYLPDGEIEYLGRLDHQTKIRGHRVEVGEVEAVLATFPGLEESAVAVRQDDGEARLVAYYVPAGVPPTTSALRAHVRERLPEYMVPSGWVRLPALPHTPNGKVDRLALPAPEGAVSEEAYAAPRTPTEQVLCEVWAGVLGVERVGIRDGFFDVGGHSLLATQVMTRVRDLLRVDLPLRALFDGPTVEALAERVDAARRDAVGVPEVPMAPAGAREAYPLSFAQERLWFIDRMQPGSAVYNMPLALRIGGALDVDALRRALAEVVRRHAALRTVFRRGAGGPVQVVLGEVETPLPLVDLSARADAAEEAERIAAEDARAPFDLETGPLLRASLVQVGEDEHRLLLNVHHAVFDGWSTSVLVRETWTLYEAFREGRPSPLAPLALQYTDFAVWQRGWLRGEVLEAQLAYWRGKLTGAATLDLPTDRPRPPVQSHRGGRHAFSLPPQVAAELRALSRREGATLFMTVLAAVKVLLWRYAGQEEVVVGTPIAGRTRAETEPMVGMFVNTLALRTDLSGDPGFRELLGRVRESTLDAYAHQDLPFEKLVEELKTERSLSRHPVFQVSFSLQDGSGRAPETGGLAVRAVEGDTGTTKFDLTFALSQVDGTLAGVVEYSADLFDAGTIERMTEHLGVLLAGIVAAPDAPLSRLPRAKDPEELHRLLVEWNRTEAPVPALPVHRLLSEQARRTPDAEAVVFLDRRTTFAELDAAANRAARHLRSRGVGPEVRVGIFMERSPELVVAILAVLKAGGAYVPFDPAYPSDRLAYMLEDSGAALIVAHERLAGSLPGTAAPVVAWEALEAAAASEEDTDPRVAVDAETLAYVVYTSGSTGRPKGVLVPHRGIPNLTAAQRRLFDVRPGDRWLQFASLAFDAVVSEVFSTLLNGATLVLAPRERLLPGAGLLETLRDGRVTGVTLPPSVLAALAGSDLPHLRTVIAAGEACGPEVAERWARGRRFVNAYGPTETTVGAAIAVVRPDGRRPPIGRPFENTRAYVLDGEMRPVPLGVAGELYVGGIGVARGYHGKAGITAERFVPDPFSTGGARLYRTGDRVRWRPDGELEFLGRVDEQVKVRGFRIEPGEIVAALGAHPAVRDSVVVLRDGGAGGPRLVAYVVPADGARPTAPELREHLRARLPDYMVPPSYVIMDELPLTPNGKVDRRALPAPETTAGEGFVAPQGEMERKVAAIWEELLGVPSVGVDDNFFEIGGHSLLMAQLQERLKEAFGREVPMVDLFQHPTVSALARHLDAAERPAAKAAEQEKAKDRGSARRQMLRRPPRP